MPENGDDDTNCDLVTTDLVNVVSGEVESLKYAGVLPKALVSTSTVTLPSIVNTKLIDRNQEVVLKVPRVVAQKTEAVVKTKTTAYEELAAVAAAKRQKR